MKTKRTCSASIPNKTRRAVYERDGFRCALCDDIRGLQIHHVMPRSAGGSDDEMNLICLCWRCHAEAHGTFMPERICRDATTKSELRMEIGQACVEYVSDLYACMGIPWSPF